MVDFEREIITAEAPDFIFANALQTVVAHQDQGFLPLVRGRRPVTAELFVRRDSPITTVDDLAGKRIAFVGEKNL
jgi:ABC-type phosphate/phosphonate transport system substrate-binding protein